MDDQLAIDEEREEGEEGEEEGDRQSRQPAKPRAWQWHGRQADWPMDR